MNRIAALSFLTWCCCLAAQAEIPDDPIAYLKDLDAYEYLETVSSSGGTTSGRHLVPLGAIQKVRGVWAPEVEERVRGERRAFTWRVIDGFTSEEVLRELDERLAEDERFSSLFRCDARACGASVQWANKVFGERLLYGREESQSYRALAMEHGGRSYRLLLYASARSTDRQYFHAELITLEKADR